MKKKKAQKNVFEIKSNDFRIWSEINSWTNPSVSYFLIYNNVCRIFDIVIIIQIARTIITIIYTIITNTSQKDISLIIWN